MLEWKRTYLVSACNGGTRQRCNSLFHTSGDHGLTPLSVDRVQGLAIAAVEGHRGRKLAAALHDGLRTGMQPRLCPRGRNHVGQPGLFGGESLRVK